MSCVCLLAVVLANMFLPNMVQKVEVSLNVRVKQSRGLHFVALLTGPCLTENALQVPNPAPKNQIRLFREGWSLCFVSLQKAQIADIATAVFKTIDMHSSEFLPVGTAYIEAEKLRNSLTQHPAA